MGPYSIRKTMHEKDQQIQSLLVKLLWIAQDVRDWATSAWFTTICLSFPESLPQLRMWKGSLIAVNFWGIVTSSASSQSFFSSLPNSLFGPSHFVSPSSLSSDPPSQQRQANRLQQTHCMQPTATLNQLNGLQKQKMGIHFFLTFFFSMFSRHNDNRRYGWSLIMWSHWPR